MQTSLAKAPHLKKLQSLFDRIIFEPLKALNHAIGLSLDAYVYSDYLPVASTRCRL